MPPNMEYIQINDKTLMIAFCKHKSNKDHEAEQTCVQYFKNKNATKGESLFFLLCDDFTFPMFLYRIIPKVYYTFCSPVIDVSYRPLDM